MKHLIEDLFRDLELPSDKEIARETAVHNIGEGARRRAEDPTYRAKLSASLRGLPKSEISIAKRKLSMPDQSGSNNSFFGKKHSTTSLDKMRDNLPDRHGSNNPFFGKKHSTVSLDKMRKPRSQEGKANMRGKRQEKICPHCGKVGAGGNMSRYHFDNCKHKPK